MPNKEAFIIPDFSMISQFALARKGQTEVVIVVIMDSCSEVHVRRLWEFALFIQ